MTILKIVFLSLLCIPLFYMSIVFLDKLISEMRVKNREAEMAAQYRMRNIIHSDRVQNNHTYNQSRLETETYRRRAYDFERRAKSRVRDRER